MKQNRFSDEQMVTILQQAERGEQSITAICKEHGMAENTFYRWRQKYGGLRISEGQRLRELEREHARLKRLLAERDLEVDAGTLWVKKVLAKKLTSAHQRRAAVAVMVERGISQRRTCVLAAISDSSLRYRARPRSDHALLHDMQELARRQPRYGYRRVWAVLRRTHPTVNHKRVYRLWRHARLPVPRRPKRKRSVGTGALPCQALYPGYVWTYDFVHDRCANGTALKILTLVDEFTRESFTIEVATSLTARAVQRVLNEVVVRSGPPHYLRSDNGPEFIAQALRQWLGHHGLQTMYIELGHPWQNGLGESFNGKFRDECLNMQWFWSLAGAKVQIARWRQHYNMERPHSSLGYQTPHEFVVRWQARQQVETLT